MEDDQKDIPCYRWSIYDSELEHTERSRLFFKKNICLSDCRRYLSSKNVCFPRVVQTLTVTILEVTLNLETGFNVMKRLYVWLAARNISALAWTHPRTADTWATHVQDYGDAAAGLVPARELSHVYMNYAENINAVHANVAHRMAKCCIALVRHNIVEEILDSHEPYELYTDDVYNDLFTDSL